MDKEANNIGGIMLEQGLRELLYTFRKNGGDLDYCVKQIKDDFIKAGYVVSPVVDGKMREWVGTIMDISCELCTYSPASNYPEKCFDVPETTPCKRRLEIADTILSHIIPIIKAEGFHEGYKQGIEDHHKCALMDIKEIFQEIETHRCGNKDDMAHGWILISPESMRELKSHYLQEEK